MDDVKTAREPLPLLDLLPVSDDDAPLREIRVLTADEITTLEPVFAERGVELPAPAHSFIVGAIEDGTVVAFLVIQLRVHAEPEWIRAGHEHVHNRLIHTAEKEIMKRILGGTDAWVDVFLFTSSDKTTRMAELAGMTREPWVVMSKRLHGLPVTVPENSESEKSTEGTVH